MEKRHRIEFSLPEDDYRFYRKAFDDIWFEGMPFAAVVKLALARYVREWQDLGLEFYGIQP